MRKLKAVLFDIDGTLLDSAEFIYRAFEYVLHERKLPPRSRADMAAVMGASLEECYRVLAGGGDLAGWHDECGVDHLRGGEWQRK